MSDKLREALDSLLAFRHGDTKHLTSEHARVLYAALSAPQTDTGGNLAERERHPWNGATPPTPSADMRRTLEIACEFIKGEPIENAVVCIGSMQSLGEFIDEALSRADGHASDGKTLIDQISEEEFLRDKSSDTVNCGRADEGKESEGAIDPVLGAESASGAHVADRTGGANPPTGATPPDREALLTEQEWRDIDDLCKHWHSFCDADRFDGSDTFSGRMEAAGLIELAPVDDDALAEAFAAERGIEPDSMMWALTNAGRLALQRAEGE